MDQAQFIDAVSEKCDESRRVTTDVIKAGFEVMQESLLEGEEIIIAGIGKLSIATRAARKGHDIKTGKMRKYPATKTIKFKPFPTIKKTLNGK